LEVFLNFYFLSILAIFFLFSWSVASYFYWRMGRRKASEPRPVTQPAFRLAEQWISESQRKLEALIEEFEQPLSTAQNELLELRLEAGRLPQGVKELKLVRESINGSLKPASLNKNLIEMASLYLGQGGYEQAGDTTLILKTPLGDLSFLQAEEDPMPESRMKSLLSKASQSFRDSNVSSGPGGFLYFGNDEHYRACIQNPGWMAGLQAQRWMVMDFKGLTTLFLSLRLARDTQKVAEAFGEGVQSTLGLVGQSEKMNLVLSALNADSMRARVVIEGSAPGDFNLPA
jgi:hypothetical protein